MDRAAHKLAFIHFAKAAGRYVDHYLCTEVFASGGPCLAGQECKAFNSWHPPFRLGRDWSEAELLDLARNRFPAQYPTPEQVREHHRRWSHDYLARQYVHNHHHSWSREAVRAFRRNGWLTFMFLRDPAELLCSLWTWARGQDGDRSGIINPTWLPDLPLDGFLRNIVDNPELHVYFALPDYVDEIDFVAEFSDAEFGRFLQERLGHRYRPPEHVDPRVSGSSGNPGYAAYRSRGLIGDGTHALLEADADVRRVRARLGPGAQA